jgi:hypothetical protein
LHEFNMSRDVAVLLLVDYDGSSLLWGLARFPFGRFGMGRVAGLRFYKILGSGVDGGFWVKPSWTRQGLFCVFDGDAAADAFLKSPLVAAYKAHAREFATVKLDPFSVRGSWGGFAPKPSIDAPAAGPLAALTRASIRPAKAAQFWRQSPPSEVQLQQAKGVELAVGLGEAPVFRQATFSLWASVADMDAYARSGAHQEAVKRSYGGNFFSEAMFVRFVPRELTGTWKGRRLDGVLAPKTAAPVAGVGAGGAAPRPVREEALHG